MSDSERAIAPVEVRWGSDRYTYYLTDDSVVVEWKSGMDLSKTCWPLHGLSPNLKEISGRSSGSGTTVRISLLLIASSVIVFFSDYNKAIPLLAPFLLFLGAWWLINVSRKLVPRNWTVVRKSSGEDAFSLVQPKVRSDAWVLFERELSEAIRRANPSET
jgi:hypothetical protein